MGKSVAHDMVVIPKEEYRFLKKLYSTVKRQQFLFRLDEAEKKFKTEKAIKVSIDRFIERL